jgi:hypothetical protein
MGFKEFMVEHGFAKADESNTSSKPQSRPAKPAKSTLPPLDTGAQTQTDSTVNQADLSKFDSYFSDLFHKINLPGPDYFELWKMMSKLKDRIADRPTRLSVAIDSMSAISSSPITKEHLVSTAKQYIAAVEKDRADTDREVKSINDSELGGLQKEIDVLDKTISDSRQKIVELQQLCLQSEEQIGQKKTQLVNRKRELEANHQSYYAAADSAVANIQSDIQLIETQLL